MADNNAELNIPIHIEDGNTESTNNESSEVNEMEELIDSLSRQLDSISKPEIHFYDSADTIEYVNYRDETQMSEIMRLIQKDLSEPYSIYTYRYFIHNWPQLCFLVCIFNRF